MYFGVKEARYQGVHAFLEVQEQAQLIHGARSQNSGTLVGRGVIDWRGP